MAHIFVVDDEDFILVFLSALLGRSGHKVSTFAEASAALESARSYPPDLVITDHRMKPMDGMELLRELHAIDPHLPVILISGYEEVGTVLEALKLGAYDFIHKPVEVDILRDTVDGALIHSMQFKASTELPTVSPHLLRFGSLVAASPAMHKVCDLVRVFAQADTPLLIHGPEFTAKGLVAETIHRLSQRSAHGFAMLDAAKESPIGLNSRLFGFKSTGHDAPGDEMGLLGLAASGTLYIANIEQLSVDVQQLLADMLATGRYSRIGSKADVPANVRLIAGSTLPPDDLRFVNLVLPSLAQRVSLAHIAAPALRDRREDIVPLFELFINGGEPARPRLFEVNLMARLALQSYTWPRNIAELREAAQHAARAAINFHVTKDSLPPHVVKAVDEAQLIDTPESGSHAQQGRLAKAFLVRKREEYEALLGQEGSETPAR